MGRVVPETKNRAVRELIEGNYRIIYEILSGDVILVQTVWHSARPLIL
jgi:mRNA-degrading endonuclease RelE of RelBE toxin-antitoxin system